MKGLNPRVKEVTAGPNYRLRLVFTDGTSGIYDCSGLLDHGIFRDFRNAAYFACVTVRGGTVAWPNGQDICPDTLYLDSERVNATEEALAE
jgi:uncharacterized protein DUF2442